jgi:hypothetical protein
VAAAALVPVSLLELTLPSKSPPGSFKEWPEPLRRRVKRAFKISNDVIGIRLYHLGKAKAPEWSQGFWRRPSLNARATPLSRAERTRRALGQRTVSLAARAIGSEVVSPTEVKRLLGGKMGDIQTALGV